MDGLRAILGVVLLTFCLPAGVREPDGVPPSPWVWSEFGVRLNARELFPLVETMNVRSINAASCTAFGVAP